MNKETGGTAFPEVPGPNNGYEGLSGMTLRDYFAGKALAGYFAAPYTQHLNAAHQGTAEYCYQMADAMLLERSK